jgi:glycosyltransferase involved in cell wall biosynthesis
MARIKVLQTIRQGKIGGGESHVLTLVQELDKNRFEPVVLSFTPGPMVDELNKMGVETHVIYTERGFDIAKFGTIKKFLQDNKIQLVHNHGTRATSNLWWACKQLNIPMLYTVHGWSFHDDQGFLMKNARIASEAFLTRKVNCTISVSYSNQETGKHYIKGFQSRVVRYGIDLKKFNADGVTSNIREHYNINPNHLLIGYIVRMDIQKDPINMIKAYKQVCDQRKDVTLLMIGEGPLKAETLALIDSLGIKDRVVVDNFRQDVPNVLAGIDVYCLPSLWEGLPIGMMEAVAMRKCVVVSAVDGSKEIIKDGENGLLVTPQKPDELAAALIRVIDDEGLRKKTAENALKTVQEEFNAVTMTRKIEDLYTEFLGKK